MANKNGELFLVRYNNNSYSGKIVDIFTEGVRKVVKLDKFAKIKEQRLKGFNKSQVSRNLELDYKTVTKYWNMTNEEYINCTKQSKSRNKKVDKYKDIILDWIKEYRDISTAQIQDWLLERYDELDFKDRTLRLYVSNLRSKYNLPKEVSMRQYEAVQELPMGFQAQVDFGEIWLKRLSGSKVKVYCFAMVLSHSRYKFLWWQDRPFTTLTFIDAHNKAFEYFGGMPKEIVYDQDRILAVSENAGDIIYTEGFQNYLNNARFGIRLCRAFDPESKGKIEAVVKFAKYNFAKNRIFDDIDSFNEDSLKWLERTGNKKVHEVTKKVPKEVFTLERDHLSPVPNLFSSKTNTNILTYLVRKDNTLIYKQNRYQVPKGTYKPGLEVKLKTLNNKLDIINVETGEIIVTHSLNIGKGNLIQVYHPERIKNKSVEEIFNKTLLALGNTDNAKELLENISKEKTRYIKDQFGLILKEIKKYEKQIIEESIEYCIERKLYSAGIFKDALAYISIKKTQVCNDKIYAPAELNVPSKYKGLKPKNRDINEYINSFKGDKDTWKN